MTHGRGSMSFHKFKRISGRKRRYIFVRGVGGSKIQGYSQYLFQGDMCTLVIHFNFYAPLNKYTTFVCMRTSFLKFGKLKRYSSILCREMKMRLD